jgi:hypothetical protein
MAWKAIDRYSKVYEEMQTKDRSSSTRPRTQSCEAAEICDQVVEEVGRQPAV